MSNTFTNTIAVESTPVGYWNQRAADFATQDEGLPAVCSYGMPRFYNQSIDLCQRLALKPWLRSVSDVGVLDVGCGVGRWSLQLARQGAHVTGVDISSTMLEEADRRAEKLQLTNRCRFMAQDLADLNTGDTYSLIFGVTVLQHILQADRLSEAVRRLASHLRPDGKLILLEAAPTQVTSRCDTKIFTARSARDYLDVFSSHGLELHAMTGVDPMPLKTMFLPHYRQLPRAVATAGLAAVTLVSLPVDVLLGRLCVTHSWHKLFVLQHMRRRSG